MIQNEIRLLLILILLGSINPNIAYCQNTKVSKSFRAKITDKDTAKPLIYASVFNKTTKRGTTSNLKGYFRLNGINVGDTIVVSYIGYESETIIFNPKKLKKSINLKPKNTLLDQVEILGENLLLYKLITKCKENRFDKSRTSKTYLSVKTKYENEQIELVESYYNAKFTGYNIDDFFLKNGRIALKKHNNRFFNSLGTSRAIFKHKLLKSTRQYPHNPFDLSKRKLKKYYNLKLISKYKDLGSNTIYEIGFSPKKKKEKYFEGKVWVDSTNMRIKKIILIKQDTKFHPFIAIGLDSVKKVDLYISKTFFNIEGEQYINSINFKYKIWYKPIDSSEFIISTNAFLYAYNYDEKFHLPLYKFHNSVYHDYRQILSIPYNKLFWDNINEFRIDEGKENNDEYVNKSNTCSINRFVDLNSFKEGFFEHPFVFWSKERIGFNDDNEDYTKYANQIPSDRYNFNVQIFLDMNFFNDSLNILTKTIFDPFNSYYRFEHTDMSKAFINMYFDLMEIQRKKISEKIKQTPNINFEKIERIYKNQMIEAKRIGKQFFQEVQRGTIRNKMIEWNNYIRNELSIDNLAIFNEDLLLENQEIIIKFKD